MPQDQTWFAPVAAFAAGAVGQEPPIHGAYRMQVAALIKQISMYPGRDCVSKAFWHGGFDMLRALRKSSIFRRVLGLKTNKYLRKTLLNK